MGQIRICIDTEPLPDVPIYRLRFEKYVNVKVALIVIPLTVSLPKCNGFSFSLVWPFDNRYLMRKRLVRIIILKNVIECNYQNVDIRIVCN